MKSKIVIGFLVCLALLLGSAACGPSVLTKLGPTSTAAGTWQNLSGGNEVIDLLVDGNKVWAATSGGVVCWNVSDGSNKKYTAQDGLAGNTVSEIIKDTKGNIWVSCYMNGVSRFDGNTWQTFTVENGLVSNDVITLAPDNSGGIWVSAYWGVSLFNGENWASYSDADPNSMVTGGDNPMKECKNLTHIDAPLSAVDAIFTDSHDNIWFSSRSDGVTRYKDGEWTVFAEEDGIGKGGARPYLEDDTGNIWAGCMSDVSRFDGEKWETFHFSDNIPRPYVQNIVQDNNGDIWVTAWENIVARFDGTKWQYYTAADGLPADTVSLLFKDKNGVLYAAAGNKISCFQNGAWQLVTDTTLTGKIRAVTVDGNGVMWFGTSDGVVRYGAGAPQTMAVQGGLPDNSITAIAEDNLGNIWFGGRDGSVSRYSDSGLVSFRAEEVGVGDYILSLLADSRGNIWTAAANGVSRYDGTAWQLVAGALGIVEDNVNPFFEDSSGKIWFNSAEGIMSYDGTVWSVRNELKNLTVTGIAEDSSGNLWFGGNEILRFDGTEWQRFNVSQKIYRILPGRESDVWLITKDHHVFRYIPESKLVEPVTDDLPFQPWIGGALLDSQNNLWMATFYVERGGLNRYDGKEWKTYTPKNGLADYQVTALLEDKQGTIWAVTKKGISYYDGAAWHTLTEKDGLAGNSVNCLLEDSKGNLWFGTNSGASCLVKNS